MLQRFLSKFTKGHTAILVASLAVLFLGILVSYLFAKSHEIQLQDLANNTLSRRSGRISEAMTRHLNSYELLLVSSASLFKLRDNVTRQEWHEYVDGLDFENRFPGTLGVGYAEHFTFDELENHERTIQSQDLPDYTVRPKGDREEYTAIAYLEPFNEVNKRALGYDMLTESKRREAMEKARDTGAITMSAPVLLIQEESRSTQPGVLLYAASYESIGSENPTSIPERRESLSGYTYTVLRVNDLMHGLFESEISQGDMAFSVSDISGADDQALYSSPAYQTISEQQTSLKRTQIMPVADRQWKFNFAISENSSSLGASPLAYFVIGVSISTLAAGIMFDLLTKRLMRLTELHTAELEKTKTDLLALASHQLRTPATGVKQYVGMLTQGYAGKLTEEQLTMLNKAYSANERQLSIINELLYVAKADAEQLNIELEHFRLNRVVREAVEHTLPDAIKKNVKITHESRTEIMVRADHRYLNMAIGNIINNAIKYSHPNSRVLVIVDADNTNAYVKVKDSGVGIAKEDIPKLFKKFNRLSNEYSRTEGGTGLGLFLAMRIAEAHGGTISVTSSEGAETTFTLVLPLDTSGNKKRSARSF